MGHLYGCGLGPTWLRLLRAPPVSTWSTLAPPVSSLTPPSIISTINSVCRLPPECPSSSRPSSQVLTLGEGGAKYHTPGPVWLCVLSPCARRDPVSPLFECINLVQGSHQLPLFSLVYKVLSVPGFLCPVLRLPSNAKCVSCLPCVTLVLFFVIMLLLCFVLVSKILFIFLPNKNNTTEVWLRFIGMHNKETWLWSYLYLQTNSLYVFIVIYLFFIHFLWHKKTGQQEERQETTGIKGKQDQERTLCHNSSSGHPRRSCTICRSAGHKAMAPTQCFTSWKKLFTNTHAILNSHDFVKLETQKGKCVYCFFFFTHFTYNNSK